MLKGNVQNRKFCTPSRFADLVRQNGVLEMNLCGTPDRPRIAFHIVEGTHFAWRIIHGYFATVQFALSWCRWYELQAGLFCNDIGHLALTYFRPIDGKNVVLTKAFGRRIWVIDASWALAGALAQDGRRWNNVLDDYRSDYGRRRG